MRIVWASWLIHHFNGFGYSNGILRGAIGTLAVLLTAALLGYVLRRWRPIALTVAGVVTAGGIGWLMAH